MHHEIIGNRVIHGQPVVDCSCGRRFSGDTAWGDWGGHFGRASLHRESSRRNYGPRTVYYLYVSGFFGFGTLGAFAYGAPVMGFLWGSMFVTSLLLPKLRLFTSRGPENDPVTRAPRDGSTQQPPGMPIWSTGLRYDPGVHGNQPGMRAGDTMRPTAEQNAARNVYGSNAS